MRERRVHLQQLAALAPIRLGVGLRAGANVGYIHDRREKSIDPF